MTDGGGGAIIANRDHGCFGCGQLNDRGLKLTFFENPGTTGVWTRWMPTADFEGYGGIIHGGIVCTILDEVMAWSLYRDATWAVTASMSTRFRQPLVVGEAIIGRGEIVRDRGRLIDLRGEIARESDGVVLAEATATFMRVPAAQARVWEARYQPVRQGRNGG